MINYHLFKKSKLIINGKFNHSIIYCSSKFKQSNDHSKNLKWYIEFEALLYILIYMLPQ